MAGFNARNTRYIIAFATGLLLAMASPAFVKAAEPQAATGAQLALRPELHIPLTIKPRLYWVQLAAYSSNTKAAQQWATIRQTNASAVAGLESRIDVARIANKTFFRLLAGPIINLADAQGVRERLRPLYPDCFTR